MSDLRSYVPRIVLEWAIEAPEELHRRVPGTLVFTDLSGFTALSERLGRMGRPGTEELIRHLDGVFDELLTVAAGHGGSMLKFGGDALLIFFWGVGHCRRGVAAAADMRSRLRRIGQLRTSAGRVRLRMSVGLNSGDFDLFLVGKNYRELVLTGPSTSATVRAEALADAGEIVLSAAAAQGLAPSSIGAVKGDGRLLARRPSVGQPSGPQPWVEADATGFLPPSLRPFLGEERPESEHRQAAVTFIHAMGFDQPLAEGRVSEVAARLQRLTVASEEAFAEHGVVSLGTDLYGDGFKFLACVGAPRSFEDNEERMVRAVRALFAADHGVPLRAGINRGYLFAGDVGASFRRAFTVMGDTVNTAARVMARAEPGQILVTPEVLRRCTTDFETVALEPFLAKGKSRPIAASAVRGERGRREYEPSAPMVGREPQLRQLRAARARAASGTGAAFEIVAPAGLGKTRLARELTVDSDGGAFDVIRATAEQYQSATPYATAAVLLRAGLGLDADADADALAQVVASVAPDLMPMLPLIGVPLGLVIEPTETTAAIDPHFAAERLRATVVDLLARARRRPTIWWVDDGHWLDQVSAQLVRDLATMATGTAWLVLITSRSPRLGGAVDIVELSPLEIEAGYALARALGLELLPIQLDEILDRAEGNPLFLTDLLRSASEGASPDELPASVESMVASQIDQLEPSTRTMLRHMAVLGTQFDVALLDEVIGPGWRPCIDALAPFVRLDSETGGFHHALVREVAYEALPYGRRRELHQRAGSALEARLEPPADLLSLHFAAARDWLRTWEWARVAGEAAWAGFAPGASATHHQRALAAAAQLDGIDDPAVEEVCHRLAQAQEYSARFDAADRAALAGLRLARGSPLREARFRELRAELSRKASRTELAVRRFRQIVRLLADDSSAEAARYRGRALVGISFSLHDLGRYSEAVTVARQALAEAQAAGDEPLVAHAHVALFNALSALGDHEAAKEFRDLPVEVYRSHDSPLHLGAYYVTLGVAEHRRGRWATAADWYGEAAATSARAGDERSRAMALNNKGEILVEQGFWADASRLFEEARRVWRPSGFRAGVAVAGANLGRALGRAGDAEAGLELLRSSAAELIEMRVGEYGVLALAWTAEIEVLAGQSPGNGQLKAALAASGSEPWTWSLRAFVSRLDAALAARANDSEAARRHLVESLAAAERAGDGFEMARTVTAWRAHSDVAGWPDNELDPDAVFAELGVVRVPDL